MKLTISKDTKGWEVLRKQLMELGKTELDVGFINSHYGAENDNLPHALIAQVQEEGSPSQNIPPRPFIRVGFKDYLKSGKADQNFVAIMKLVMSGQSVLKAYTQAGPYFVKHLQDVMKAWDTPPNAPYTVAQKGFNNPLIETGELVNSVDFKVGKS